MTGTAPSASARLEAWLLGTRHHLPEGLPAQLRNGMFGSVPIFLGGVINTILVAAVAAWIYPTFMFITWLALESCLGVARMALLISGRRAIAEGRKPPYLAAALLACAWSASVGFGTIACMVTQHWILAIIVCLSAAGMVCGVCLRNYGTPRLAALMGALILTPCAVAPLLTNQPLLIIISVQLPLYMLTIFASSFSLHRLMVSRMVAVRELESSKSLNETILQSSPDYTVILNCDYQIVYSNRPPTAAIPPEQIMGTDWLDLLPPEDKPAALYALQQAEHGHAGNLLSHYFRPNGDLRWLDIVTNRISDSSGRIIVVARDITHQKKSEEQALWMAHHDGLTGLPNRALLQERLDAMLFGGSVIQAGALLLLDVDNFKTINDTLGHDAGDTLLCTFAARLKEALSEDDLVARTGGDEFAIITDARTDEDLHALGERIFGQLREPFCHDGRLLECGASIGASLLPRDGKSRSEIMKAADIALYAAKASGRAQLKVFEASMMQEVERHQSMIASARTALQCNTIIPHYQPKVSLRTSRIIGFEALLRWRDRNGNLQGPDVLKAAFDDPALARPLSNRMLDAVLDDVRSWLEIGLDFGHVAVNVTASDFRSGAFARNFLQRLEDKQVPPSCIQIEVTETVFLGRGAGYVEEALKELNEHGIRIALDDFGTGYASLSHLNQFPVDLLKIDRSFIKEIGLRPDAEAISATVINLGHCLGLEVIAEGIETPEQEAHLISVGCDTGQGFLYAQAMPAIDVPRALLHQHFRQPKKRRA